MPLSNFATQLAFSSKNPTSSALFAYTKPLVVPLDVDNLTAILPDAPTKY